MRRLSEIRIRVRSISFDKVEANMPARARSSIAEGIREAIESNFAGRRARPRQIQDEIGQAVATRLDEWVAKWAADAPEDAPPNRNPS